MVSQSLEIQSVNPIYSSLSKQKNKYEEGEYRKCVEVYGFNPSWTDKQVGLQLKLFRFVKSKSK